MKQLPDRARRVYRSGRVIALICLGGAIGCVLEMMISRQLNALPSALILLLFSSAVYAATEICEYLDARD